MDINSLYDNNAVFQHYVDAYAKKMDISPEEALQHKMVAGAAEYYVEKTKNVIVNDPVIAE